MQVDYSKLWARYKEMGHKNKTDLIEMAGISTNILAKLTKGEFISMVSSDVKDFNRFLDERRRLMALKIKEYYESLK